MKCFVNIGNLKSLQSKFAVCFLFLMLFMTSTQSWTLTFLYIKQLLPLAKVYKIKLLSL